MNLGGDQYQPFGVVELPGAEFLPPDDKGRFEVTKSVSDEYVFSTACRKLAFDDLDFDQ